MAPYGSAISHSSLDILSSLGPSSFVIPLMALRRLILSNVTHRKARTILTVAAITLSVSLVVAVTSGYASAQAALIQLLTQYMGSNNVQISPKGSTDQAISGELVKAVSDDRDVEQVVGRLET